MKLLSVDPLVSRFHRLLETTQVRTGTGGIVAGAVVVALLAIGWSIVYAANGTGTPFPYVMMVPVIIASVTFGLLGGAATAIVAALLLGLMPHDVALDIDQPLLNPIVRGGLFLLVGVFTGTSVEAARVLSAHLRQAHAERAERSLENVRLFARLVAGRDEQTGRHCERVGLNAVALARAAGVPEDELQHYYWAGVFHDLGKLRVPEDILRKPVALNDEECEVMMQHPAFGEQIVLSISPSASEIARGTRSHHERWDGAGYPDGLAGEAIPLIGRILAIVDVFEAVTGSRPYRGPMALAEARRLISEGAGTHFDPRLVDVFLALERRGEIQREVEGEAPHPSAAPSSAFEAGGGPS